MFLDTVQIVRATNSLRVLLYSLVFLLGFQTMLDAQRRLGRMESPYTELERAEAEERLRHFQLVGIPGNYSFRFELQIRPRRGSTETVRGQVWSARNPIGPVSLYRMESPERDSKGELLLLIQNGIETGAWQAREGQGGESEPNEPQAIEIGAMLDPIGRTQITPFDLQMPFIFWPEFEYDGIERIRGRSAHAFFMLPTEEYRSEHPDLGGVRLLLDAEFNALVGAEIISVEDEVLKSFMIQSIRRVEDHWMVRTIDLRDEESRDKTRLHIRAAAFEILMPAVHFHPDHFHKALPDVPGSAFSPL